MEGYVEGNVVEDEDEGKEELEKAGSDDDGVKEEDDVDDAVAGG